MGNERRRAPGAAAVRHIVAVNRQALTAALVLLVGGLAVWGFMQTRTRAPITRPPASERLQDFVLPDLDDQPRSIKEWSGRPLIINFWATWCAPCRREMPLLQQLVDDHGDTGLQVVGIAMDNLSDVRKFIAQTGIRYPMLYGELDASNVAESFGDAFVGLPFSVIVAPQGDILALWAGELDSAMLRRMVVELDAVATGRRSAAQARDRLAAE